MKLHRVARECWKESIAVLRKRLILSLCLTTCLLLTPFRRMYCHNSLMFSLYSSNNLNLGQGTEKTCHAHTVNESQLLEHHLLKEGASPLTKEGDHPATPYAALHLKDNINSRHARWRTEQTAMTHALSLVSEKSGRNVLFDYVCTFPGDL